MHLEPAVENITEPYVTRSGRKVVALHRLDLQTYTTIDFAQLLIYFLSTEDSDIYFSSKYYFIIVLVLLFTKGKM